MNITDRRYIPQDLYSFIKLIQYDKYPIKLLGSAGTASQQYYSDYDLFSSIKSSPKSCSKVYNTIKEILDKTDQQPDMYFIEYKLQTKDGKKIRYLQDMEEFCQSFKDIEFIKLDYVIRIDNRFMELSIIYSFASGKTDFIKSVKADIDELYREGKYYKVLKRLFSLLSKRPKSIERDNKLVLLTKFFNSDIGRLYRDASNIKAIKLLIDSYNEDTAEKDEMEEDLLRRKIAQNLRDIGLDIKDLPKLERKYNKEALQILRQIEKE